MSKDSTINPPRPIYATPPACAEARAIAKRGTLEAQIEENTPSWRAVFKDIFGGE